MSAPRVGRVESFPSRESRPCARRARAVAGRYGAEQAAHLVDRVLPKVAYRHWVLTLPFELTRLVAYDRSLCGAVFAGTRSDSADELQELHRRAARAAGIEAPHAGCVLEIQRFSDAAGLWPHGHAIVPEGVFHQLPSGKVCFRRSRPPKPSDVARMVTQLAGRVRRLLIRRGLVDTSTGPPRLRSPKGQLLLQWASLKPSGQEGREPRPAAGRPKARHTKALQARCAGFELHAGVRVKARDRAALERLARYIARPALPQERIHLREDGKVLFKLKRFWKGGITALVFEPLAFVARVAAALR